MSPPIAEGEGAKIQSPGTKKQKNKSLKVSKSANQVPKPKKQQPIEESKSSVSLPKILEGRVEKKKLPKLKSGQLKKFENVSGARTKSTKSFKSKEHDRKDASNIANTEPQDEEDPFPGDAPIPHSKLVKHKRGESARLSDGIVFSSNKHLYQKKEKMIRYTSRLAARSEILLQEESGFLEAGQDEYTSEIRQVEIKSSVDITSATKQFDLSLKFGPYAINYLRNGRKMLIGGRMGHVAAFDWVTKSLTCEMNVMESVYDVAWLHNETLFAVAQKDWTYIYDNQGIEVHCIKQLNNVVKMEFLPYHFLLATASDRGWLSWLDVSMGKMVRRTPTHLGRLDVMCQNPSNAVICCGHSKGTVTMWTPNFEAPVVKMLCHKHPVRAVAIDQRGWYMATSSVDSSVKIWDLRTYNCLQSYKMGCGVSNMTFSQKNLLAVSLGNVVELYKNICTETVRHPYLKHRVGSSISGLEFCPYEDVLGVSHASGMCSMLVPGAGEPNFDALESNPFQTKSQRRETEVKSLLGKIQPEFITLDPFELGEVNRPSVIEKFEEKTRYMFDKPPKIDLKPRKNAKTVNQFHIKRRLQLEERMKHAATVGEVTRNLAQVETVPTKPEKPSVLDRFKQQPKKKNAK